MPVLILRSNAVAANIDGLARFCREEGVELAPHAKTPMMPYIFERQLKAGAWGLTVATVEQARVCREHGASRILLANQVLDSGSLRYLSNALAADESFSVACLVDSLRGTRLMENALPPRPARPLDVLVELGIEGGRAGVRDDDEGLALARAVGESGSLRLAGVSVWDGIFTRRNEAVSTRLDAARALFSRAQRLVGRIRSEGIPSRSPLIVSAGTTAFFDQAAAVLKGNADVEVVVRCGGYITGDELYAGLEASTRSVAAPTFVPALELWARVLSRPDPDVAIVGFGRRDTSADTALPTLFARRREGFQAEPLTGATVRALHDHHAIVAVNPAASLEVGDLVGARVVHSCSTFDRWRNIAIVDDEDALVGVERTHF